MVLAWEALLVATRLGLTSFGGPVAHIGYFRQEYVVRRQWLTEERFAELVALCQFLPGPASSQLGIAVGIGRAGYLGGLAAWLGFTFPSAVALILFAYGVQEFSGHADDWLHGLKDCRRRSRRPGPVGHGPNSSAGPAKDYHRGARRGGAAVYQRCCRRVGCHCRRGGAGPGIPSPRKPGTGGRDQLAVFLLLLAALPVAARLTDNGPLEVADSFYRSGSLVFGGGHVVLPLLEAEVVPPGWVGEGEFVAGYGAAQAVPGPLFTFSAYLGTVMNVLSPRWVGGILALGAIFLPSFLLVAGVLAILGAAEGLHAGPTGVEGRNAAVVGLLLAALYDPVWTSAIAAPEDFALAAGAFVLLAFWKAPPWLVVLLTAVAGG